MATPPWGGGLLALTGATPDCKDFVTAKYAEQRRGMTANVDFSNICSTLHTLQLPRCNDAFESLTELTSMPNLTYLQIDHGFRDLHGLDTLATLCPKLRILDLQWLCREDIENLERFWQILSTMDNLRVLMLQLPVIPVSSNPPPLPKLTAIKLDDDCTDWARESDNAKKVLSFLSRITTLRVLDLSLPAPITSGWERLLHSCRLTHFSVSNYNFYCGPCRLPVDPSCYADMEEFFLRNFVLKPDLANALAQAKKLSVLVLDVCYYELKAIRDIMNMHLKITLQVSHLPNEDQGFFSEQARGQDVR